MIIVILSRQPLVFMIRTTVNRKIGEREYAFVP